MQLHATSRRIHLIRHFQIPPDKTPRYLSILIPISLASSSKIVSMVFLINKSKRSGSSFFFSSTTILQTGISSLAGCFFFFSTFPLFKVVASLFIPSKSTSGVSSLQSIVSSEFQTVEPRFLYTKDCQSSTITFVMEKYWPRHGKVLRIDWSIQTLKI